MSRRRGRSRDEDNRSFSTTPEVEEDNKPGMVPADKRAAEVTEGHHRRPPRDKDVPQESLAKRLRDAKAR
jgi:hypothetical protein